MKTGAIKNLLIDYAVAESANATNTGESQAQQSQIFMALIEKLSK